MAKKQEKKFSEIDKHIAIRMSKGYITEKEISRLAKLHSVEEDAIRQRVEGKIRKDDKKVAGKSKTLDISIEKIINENLKIVNIFLLRAKSEISICIC